MINLPCEKLLTDKFLSCALAPLFEWVAACDADSEANQSVGKKDFLIFSSDIFIERVFGETEGSFKTLPESLKEIRVGVFGGPAGVH